MYFELSTPQNVSDLDVFMQSEDSQAWTESWIRFSFRTTLSFSSVVLNVAMLWGTRNPSLRKTNKSIYMGSLAAAGIVTGLNSFAFALAVLLERYQVFSFTVLCLGYLTIRDASVYVALLHMAVLSFERWRSVHRPFQYIRKSSRTVVMVTIVTCWFVGFALFTIFMSYGHTNRPVSKQNSDVLSALIFNETASTLHGYHWPSVHSHTTEMYTSIHQEMGRDEELKISVNYPPNDFQDFSESLTFELELCRSPYIYNTFSTFIASALQLLNLLVILSLNLSAFIKSLSRKKVHIRRSLSSGDNRDQAPLIRVSNSESKRQSRVSSDFTQQIDALSYSTRGSCEEIQDGVCAKYIRRLSSTSSLSTHLQISSSYLTLPHHTSSKPPVYCSMGNSKLLNRSSPDIVDTRASNRLIPIKETRRRRASSPARTCSTKQHVDKTERPSRSSNAELAQNMLQRQDRNAACWLAMLTISLLVFCLPHSLVLAVSAVSGVTVPTVVREISVWLHVATAVLNPLLYGFSNAMFRKALLQRWRKTFSKSKRNQYSISAGLSFVLPEHMKHRHEKNDNKISAL
ncbi:histamine H1 receptor [Elysia marginata]|uniref:Histamine H1 receptor n=1 Tax=Elysia marginata TaxID=1093978 RepID=A0AAV4GFM3_9GAST|nr:histamine H1 receptor [Elysia marginata]